jgi:acetyl-CoA carboxylase biotin carboxyl carrier protein
MDLRKLKTLVDLVAESGISELEITEAEGKVRIVKAVPVAPPYPGQVFGYPAPMPGAMPAGAALPAGGPAPSAVATPETQPAAIEGKVVKSPMVGTFYRSPNPESAPFVEIGQAVKIGDPLCIIEAMKLMNEIESEHAGTVKEILVDNGQPVEYGQPLFVLD